MKLTTDNILKLNGILVDLIQNCNKENATVEMGTALTNALTTLIENEKTIEEMKQYEFQCEIELYPLVQYIEANTAEEAIELMEQQIEDTGFLQDLTSADFHCDKAEIVKTTKEYKQYIDKHKRPLEDK